VNDWVDANASGRCVDDATGTTGWPLDSTTASWWNYEGVNVGNSFSAGWATTESVQFKRDMIFDRPGTF